LRKYNRQKLNAKFTGMYILDFQPLIKTRATVVKTAVDKQADTVIMIAEIGPHEQGPPLHIHTSQHETYEVLEGEAEFILGTEKRKVLPGETVVIPPNTPHTFRNTGDAWLKMRDTHAPALSFEEMMRELHTLVVGGKIKGFKDARSLVYLSMLWVKHKQVQRSVKPPFFVMRAMALAGSVLGFKV